MTDFHLPDNTAAFLRAHDQLKYDFDACEAGKVGLKRLNELEPGEVWIGTSLEDDPHFEEEGYYSVPAVSLSGECACYEPDYLLLWLPNERLFGTFDAEHSTLTVFPDTGWDDIIADPATYLNAQWDPTSPVGEKFQPWPRYDFVPGQPR